MELKILSERQAVQMAKYYTTPFAIVSITCPYSKDVQFSNNPNLIAVFRMKFNDTNVDKYRIKAPTKKDFDGLKVFIDSLSNTTCKTLFVHCGAGISRSAAVGAAISEYLHLGCEIFGNRLYEPNRLVYKLAMQELGLQDELSQRDYEKIFSVNNNESRDFKGSKNELKFDFCRT